MINNKGDNFNVVFDLGSIIYYWGAIFCETCVVDFPFDFFILKEI